ncbi:bifunctional proline dehydrogenase/L-glutamate gamma-semialdehyde dehydrogenase [Brevirhabdus pacifica]|uniref:Bifunctional protein PutA n=1 Tax=Brevirhabdus pacifica TaxID=1267768 RepID=A0A1U7DMF8_9RHOB|nr:bifunctional proline dehydrogenase/L-glutamate gamma-semialdehyde dehydrogenase [Brevirhabdus pacifica]
MAELRRTLRRLHLEPQEAAIERLLSRDRPDAALRARVRDRAQTLVEEIRADAAPGLMEVFLAEYGLSTDEGIALMCLAEALLRVPDAETLDALIEDKIAPSEWGAHLGRSSSSLVNASTWALMLTGKVLRDGTGVASVLRGAVRRLGEPVIRVAVQRAMKEMGRQFVLGQTIEEAVARGARRRSQGYTHSYDMLGEAAITAEDASSYHRAYAGAIRYLSSLPDAGGDIRSRPGISVKLSALHPRYEHTQKDRVMAELAPRLLELALMAREGGMGLNIDAEEADRLELSLDVIEAVLADPRLAGWDGFGVVVQAYGQRAPAVIDWLHALAQKLDRRIMVRLVKGAYWDSEIKRAQVEGTAGFPVFTTKPATDVSYILCARKLLRMTDRIYPQFATHNAHSVAMILETGADPASYEFQRLHGMGEALHDLVMRRHGTNCRIYAPVGAHRDLLAYLVRRLLENGANSSFVNQIVNAEVPAAEIAADPFDRLEDVAPITALRLPRDLFRPERTNSAGWDLHSPAELERLEAMRAPFAAPHRWHGGPLLADEAGGATGEEQRLKNPAAPDEEVGRTRLASPDQTRAALAAAAPWRADGAERAAILTHAADLFEQSTGEILALLTREAGKTLADGIAELREAVDFLRYYAARIEDLEAPARGVFTCISPWNFPLAIFTGQIAAALAAGNAVLAKPAEATPLIAHLAVGLLHRAGVPRAALQFLPGPGGEVGAALTGSPAVGGVCFTGSTATARTIHRAMAGTMAPEAPLIAETGGLNAMIVDSTALPQQAVRDIVISAFQSAGQRCSALRMLYVQKDVEEGFLKMLTGAMAELRLGDPWEPATDVGPVIDAAARQDIDAHVAQAQAPGQVLWQGRIPEDGHFVAPTLIRLPGIAALEREVFGPILHVASFEAADLDRVVEEINATGYGLTFGIHSRIDDRVQTVAKRIAAGNVYVNRNQIGAIVGSQPFGGEGLSGTGPKAGGPHYLPRFTRAEGRVAPAPRGAGAADPSAVQRLLEGLRHTPRGVLSVTDLPGPTGESNRLTRLGRGVILCLGPDADSARAQAVQAREAGCHPVMVAPGARGADAVDGELDAEALIGLRHLDGVACWGDEDRLRSLREALAQREGAIVPLMSQADIIPGCLVERHVCVDTTAAGGNASLLAAAG